MTGVSDQPLGLSSPTSLFFFSPGIFGDYAKSLSRRLKSLERVESFSSHSSGLIENTYPAHRVDF